MLCVKIPQHFHLQYVSYRFIESFLIMVHFDQGKLLHARWAHFYHKHDILQCMSFSVLRTKVALFDLGDIFLGFENFTYYSIGQYTHSSRIHIQNLEVFQDIFIGRYSPVWHGFIIFRSHDVLVWRQFRQHFFRRRLQTHTWVSALLPNFVPQSMIIPIKIYSFWHVIYGTFLLLELYAICVCNSNLFSWYFGGRKNTS